MKLIICVDSQKIFKGWWRVFFVCFFFICGFKNIFLYVYTWESHILLQWEVSVRSSTLEIFLKKGKLHILVMESDLSLLGWEHFLDQRSSNAYSKALPLVTNEQVQTKDGFSLFFSLDISLGTVWSEFEVLQISWWNSRGGVWPPYYWELLSNTRA